MYSGPNHRQMYKYGLPMYSQDATNVPESPYSGQLAILHNFQFDGLPQTTAEQTLIASSSATVPQQYSLGSQMTMTQSPLSWSDPTQSSFGDINTDYYGHYSPNIADNPHSSVLRSPVDTKVPRSMPGQSGNGIGFFSDGNNLMDTTYSAQSPLYNMTEASPSNHESNAHFQQPQGQNQDQSYSYLNINTTPNASPSLPREPFSRLSVSQSPVPTPKSETQDTYSHDQTHGQYHNLPPSFSFAPGPSFHLHSSEDSSSAGISSREMTAAVEVEDETGTTDEPYAKLIHRALMSAPGHSMVLQEIYQWFRENTVKGSSDSKGWMNSIRHNLSMNAAFKKTERKIPGEDTKKSTEWVLEPFAVKDGVQSTTRYRKGTGNKKFNRSETPALSRQLSGRKGGMSASKHKSHRQTGKNLGGLRRVDEGRREEFHHHSRNEIIRRRSPLTPPHLAENVQGVYGIGMKVEEFESPLPFGVGEDYGTFEDTQGVYLEDTSPLFIGAQEMRFHHGLQGPLHPY